MKKNSKIWQFNDRKYNLSMCVSVFQRTNDANMGVMLVYFDDE